MAARSLRRRLTEDSDEEESAPRAASAVQVIDEDDASYDAAIARRAARLTGKNGTRGRATASGFGRGGGSRRTHLAHDDDEEDAPGSAATRPVYAPVRSDTQRRSTATASGGIAYTLSHAAPPLPMFDSPSAAVTAAPDRLRPSAAARVQVRDEEDDSAHVHVDAHTHTDVGRTAYAPAELARMLEQQRLGALHRRAAAETSDADAQPVIVSVDEGEAEGDGDGEGYVTGGLANGRTDGSNIDATMRATRRSRVVAGDRMSEVTAASVRAARDEEIHTALARPDSDDDTQAWESAQMQRSKLPTRDGAVHAVDAAVAVHGRVSQAAQHKWRLPFPDPDATVAAFMDSLDTAIDELQNASMRDAERSTQLHDEVTRYEAELQALRRQLETAGAEFDRYASLRTYVQNLSACLTAKLPLLTALDEAAASAWELHRKVAARRRVLDAADDLQTELASGGYVVRAGTLLVPDVDVSAAAAVPVGGPVAIAARLVSRSAEERQAARKSRRAHLSGVAASARTARNMLADDVNALAEVTDAGDASDGETALADSTRVTLRQAHGLVMEDVQEQYTSTSAVLTRMQQWKTDDAIAASYADAFAHLSLPTLCRPLVQWELWPWDPLTDQAVEHLEDMPWVHSAWQFGECKNAAAQDEAVAARHVLDADAADADLLRQLYILAVVPHVAAALVHTYNPYSAHNTQRAIAITLHVQQVDLPPDVAVALEQAALRGLRQAVEHSQLVLRIDPSGMVDGTSWMYVRTNLLLLRNIAAWRRVLAAAAVWPLLQQALTAVWLPACLPFVDAVQQAVVREVGYAIAVLVVQAVRVFGEGGVPVDVLEQWRSVWQPVLECAQADGSLPSAAAFIMKHGAWAAESI